MNQTLNVISSEHDSAGVSGLVERLDLLSSRTELTLEELLAGFGDTSFVTAIAVPALLLVSPLSGIPVFSSICGLMIMAVSAQMLLFRRHLWLPAWIMRRRLRGVGLVRAMSCMRVSCRWIDRLSRNRLGFLLVAPTAQVFQFLCFFAGASIPFLELVPFSSSLLGFAVLMMAAGFQTRDGGFALIGAAVLGLALGIPVTIFSGL